MLNMCSYARYTKEMLCLYYEVSPNPQAGAQGGVIVDMRHIYAYLLLFLASATEDALVEFMDLYCTKLRRKLLLLAFMHREIQVNVEAVTPSTYNLPEQARALLKESYQVI